MISAEQNHPENYQPPLKPIYKRPFKLSRPFIWLRKGISDTFTHPFSSLIYGFLLFLVSGFVIGGLIFLRMDYILLPVLAGFMVIGPFIASGLYQKSRSIALKEDISVNGIIFTPAQSPGQIFFVGVILMLVMMLWLRAAFLLYALFFSMTPFTGFDLMFETIFSTKLGWGLLGVGSLVGGLFAAFSFAISAFSIPMLLNEKKDAFTAMGISMAIAWSNKSIAIVWGLIVILAFVCCVITGFVAMIIIFPVLGHATWHAYVDMRGEAANHELSAGF